MQARGHGAVTEAEYHQLINVPQPGAFPNTPVIGPKRGLSNSRFTHEGMDTPLMVSSEYVKLLLFGDGKP